MSPSTGIPNALTIDLEEWYHGLTCTNVRPDHWVEFTKRGEVATDHLLELLSELGVRATFFVLGDLAHNSPKLIQRIAQAGHELASHGYSHQPLYKLTPEEFGKEVVKTQHLIEDITGKTVIGFRAPYFSINGDCLWAFKVLAEAGYQYDSSIFPMRTILYGYPGANRLPYRPLRNVNLVEYPLTTIRILGLTLPIVGGFYTRIFPYYLIRWGLKRLIRQGMFAVLYLHPWELDLGQPRIPVSPRERLTHYGGRKTLANKLRLLCRDFELAPLGEVHQVWLSHN
ncbi:MAG: hypothetical protein A2Z49_08390 [Chloroflexi bacterium RBG_19FT_COMBO_56_12]|nr:MAG: hypothetical protein A2Z49_08390 [Chloroflexi bacterium RBG_19FT_COMBO_56_12]